MKVYETDPLADERWANLLDTHPQASIFHSRGWLQALRKTYNYKPTAFTCSAPDEALTNAIAACRIADWVGGRRLVSLPFSDHCVMLTENAGQRSCMLGHLESELERDSFRYIEVRDSPAADRGDGEPDSTYTLHKLDLRPGEDELFRGLHQSCIQRKIKRARREGIVVRRGTTDSLLQDFYRLLVITRRRHGLPPQPIAWFQNLTTHLADNVAVWVAYKNERAIASILTLKFKQTFTYKYGASDRRYNELGATQLLLWNAIQAGKQEGAWEFDMGRSDADDLGLVSFKDRWGAKKTSLSYWRYSSQARQDKASAHKSSSIRKYVFSHAPDNVLIAAGKLLYRYMG